MTESKPEPAPVPKGRVVYDSLISSLKSFDTGDDKSSAAARDDLVTLVTQRHNFGKKKYNQPLMTEDGRDTVEDLRQEIGDAAQYAFKAVMRGEDLTAPLRLLRFLVAFLESAAAGPAA